SSPTTVYAGASGTSLNRSGDIVAFPHGTGWQVFVAVEDAAAFLGTPVYQTRLFRLEVAAGGSVSATAFTLPGTFPGANGLGWGVPHLDFVHTGDGKTPAAAPHVWLAFGGR